MKAHQGASFIFPSPSVVLRNPDVPHPFRQESHFYYLSGFDEENSCLVLAHDPKASHGFRSFLFVQPRDPSKELWDGERYGVDRAASIFSVDEAAPIETLWERLPEILKFTNEVYYSLGKDEANDQKLISVLGKLQKSKGRSGLGQRAVKDPMEPVGEMRVIKKSEELEILKKACEATAQSHLQAMKQVRPGMNEFEVQALIEYEFKKNGCQRTGYGSIVAGGKNACCLHYVSNNEPLKDGDLLLIDAGGEMDYYTSDITRTFPVGKSMSKEQKELYEIVLAANEQAISIVKPGLPYSAIHRKAQEVLAQGLKDLGLLEGSVEEIIEDRTKLFRYFPHGTGHFLGMDVHDVGLYKIEGKSRVLEPGMVFTIEPGLYAQPTDQHCPEKYRGIGIRIEDNILVTESGFQVLTSDVPKAIEEIERLR